MSLLRVDDLRVEFATDRGWAPVVDGASFHVDPGEMLGLVGESGCGKTVTSLAVLGLLPSRISRVAAGVVELDGRDLRALAARDLRAVRGGEIAMIFQEPMTSLNPAYTVGDQISEVIRVHDGGGRAVAGERAVALLDRVGIPDAARRARDYPHQFSGGMRQRVMIAMALACDPRLLIADEPTTALDVTVQAQILDLLAELRDERAMAVLLVTHDLGVVAETCDRVVVMYAGQVVEQGPVGDVFVQPLHPYTDGLLGSLPQFGRRGEPLQVIPGQVPRAGSMPPGCRFAPRCPFAEARCGAAPVVVTTRGPRQVRCVRSDDLALKGVVVRVAEAATGLAPAAIADVDGAVAAGPAAPLLAVDGLTKAFPLTSGLLRRVSGQVRAVDGVSFTIGRGETLGLVGESGSGKSTTARLVLRLVTPTAGTITFDGTDVGALDERTLRRLRRRAQMVFQDPYSSLDPRRTIAESVGEPLEVHDGLGRRARDRRVGELLEQVGLDPQALTRYPHEFSGGQRQRIAIARALAPGPDLIVCDEPLSSLDVSTQSQVINLLVDLRDRMGISTLFISHDVSVVRHLAHRIAVMYLGRIVEIGPAEEIASRATHPYTHALLSAVPVPDPTVARRRRVLLAGDAPSPVDPPTGCRFHPRCPWAMDVCRAVDPPPFRTPAGTTVHCHLHTHGPVLAGSAIADVP